MDETDESPDGSPGDERDERGASPDHTTDGDETTQYDPEAVEATVRDVEGVEYEGGNVAGASPASDLGPVEPGSPTLEGALFVLLGAALTLAVLAQLVGF